MTNDELATELAVAVGGEWKDSLLIVNGFAMAHEPEFPVIRERGKWEDFLDEVRDSFIGTQYLGNSRYEEWHDEDLINYLLTLPARTLAEKCLEVLE